MRTSSHALLLVITIALLLFSSCQKGEANYAFPSFPRHETLTAELLQGDLAINPPPDMCCTEKFILLLSLKENKLLQIYDKETGAFLRSQINFGKGNNEFTYISDLSYDKDHGILSFVDHEKQCLVRCHLTDSATCCHLESTRRGKTEPKFRTMLPLPGKRHLVAQIPIDGEPWLTAYDSTGQVLTNCSQGFKDPLESSSLDLQSYAVTSPDGRHFAQTGIFGSILQILDIQDTEISQRFIGRYIRPIGRMEGWAFNPTAETVLGACDLGASNHYLYASMINSVREDKSTIVVWNWSGEPIAQFDTGKLVAKFCIDPDDESCLYAFSVQEGQFLLEKYTLPLRRNN